MAVTSSACIPVVVLTAVKADEDAVRSYDLHANAYVTKPVDFQSFVHVMRKIEEFLHLAGTAATVGSTRGVGDGRLRNFLEYRS